MFYRVDFKRSDNIQGDLPLFKTVIIKRKEDQRMTNFASYMEMLMVICFGISWPLNIIKAWRSRSTQGISIMFYSFILAGYISALTGKLFLIYFNAPAPWYETVHWYVLLFYMLNTLMVSSGVVIYFRNKTIERKKTCDKVIDGRN